MAHVAFASAALHFRAHVSIGISECLELHYVRLLSVQELVRTTNEDGHAPKHPRQLHTDDGSRDLGLASNVPNCSPKCSGLIYSHKAMPA